MEYRIEKDTMGEVKVPADKYWGAQTERSRNNFKIGPPGSMPREIVHAFAYLKKAAALTNLGNLQRERGRHDAARASFERALAIIETRRGAEHPELAYSLQGLGELGSDAHDGARALPYVERALRLREAAKVDPVRIADSQVAVARALLQPGATNDVARARALLAAARATLEAAGEPGADILALLVAVESEHRGQLTAARTSPPPARSRSPR